VYGARERDSSSVGVIGRAHEAAGGTARQGHRTALHAAPTLTCMCLYFLSFSFSICLSLVLFNVALTARSSG
jgi:hypothetical protein